MLNHNRVITKSHLFDYTPVRAERDKCMFLLKRKRKQGLVKHDYSGIPTHVCPCGSQIIKVACIFEDGEIVLWFTEAECGLCGAKLTAPTPLDSVGMS
jgi:hypothetical protein